MFDTFAIAIAQIEVSHVVWAIVGLVCIVALYWAFSARMHSAPRQTEITIHSTTEHPDVIQRLAIYARDGTSGLAKVLRVIQMESYDKTGATLGVSDLIWGDLIVMIRRIAGTDQGVTFADAELLCSFWLATGRNDLAEVGRLGAISAIEEYESDSMASLQLLVEQKDPDRLPLSKMYIDFAALVARCTDPTNGNEQRAKVLDELKDEILDAAKTEEEVLQDLWRVVDDSAKMLESVESDQLLQSHRNTLGVSDTYSAVELKTAYRNQVALWHPDKLAGMAPELQEAATRKSAEINLAYESLLRDLNLADVGEPKI